MVRFVRFSYYKITTPCGAVRCDALLFVVRFNYAILRMVLVQFLRFMWFVWFGKHP